MAATGIGAIALKELRRDSQRGQSAHLREKVAAGTGGNRERGRNNPFPPRFRRRELRPSASPHTSGTSGFEERSVGRGAGEILELGNS